MKKFLLSFFMVVLAGMGVYSQNFNRVTQIVEASEITNGQAAYFVGTYLGNVKENASDAEAVEVLKEAGLIPANTNADSKIKLKDLCSLYAKVCGVKGGMMYNFTKKSPRYAFKEFKAKGWLPKNADPSMNVTGTNAISLFNSVTGDDK